MAAKEKYEVIHAKNNVKKLISMYPWEHDPSSDHFQYMCSNIYTYICTFKAFDTIHFPIADNFEP
jgi:hypothetical protein